MLEVDAWYKLQTFSGDFEVQYVGTKYCEYSNKFSLLVKDSEGKQNEIETKYIISFSKID